MDGAPWNRTAVLCLLLLLHVGRTFGDPTIQFLWPPPGLILRSTTDVIVQYIVKNAVVNGSLQFSGDKINGILPAVSNTMRFVGADLGSYWASAQLLDADGQPIGDASTLHYERVLSNAEAAVQRTTLPRPRRVLLALPSVVRPRQRKLCFVTAGINMDGQVRLWLGLIAALQQHPTTSYSFHMFRVQAPSALRLDPFLALGIPITNVHLEVDYKDVITYSLTNDKTMAQLAMYAKGLGRHPPYVARLFAQYTAALAPCRGAILLYANSRDHGDPALALVARHVQVQAVVLELSGLRPMPHAVDAVIGPSEFAVYHESVERAIAATHQHVIAPGVNTTLFLPAAKANTNDCLVVGYLGRIAPEKSLGLLARAAELLAAKHDLCLVFRWVGEGPDAAHYQHYPIELIGGIYNETALVLELQSWDVAVHPGLQETFGIANIEVMAVGLPLVCFGVAGTTEYVRHGENAWVVNEIDPAALAAGIEVVARDSDLRQRLGAGARATVEKRFTWSATVAAYDEVLGRLMSWPSTSAAA
ncbi:hypothetical protein SPRG_19956 [Saprolegnia parasitica CBS 223.65]|uniref:Glycosyl transferase family 1 domain-containing protein n=1 Tax=Saprolegnia parasitica (strain CBS 223.65) TaxID=695850 RepID=A0A067CDC8_SAPPC|nr:hypothetical protein SPRG_19956 [Saprolegnia parasitica CBS 223.65]KDO28739.1 hypothetical protein SPRG_19956 [Saprolegnia parasitica CBS 223.65]|eukprot:XP_012200489.1 hypothetical protein SPRG_19956 [Saprolegnia parasitica CBS 223.65]